MVESKQISKRITINRKSERDRMVIDAVELDIAPGLSMHPTILRNRKTGITFFHADGDWTVSHTKSGFALAVDLPSKRDAIILVKDIRDLCDWSTIDGDELEKRQDVGRRIKELVLALLPDDFGG